MSTWWKISAVAYPPLNAFSTFMLLGYWATTSTTAIAAAIVVGVMITIQVFVIRKCVLTLRTAKTLGALGICLAILALGFNGVALWLVFGEKPVV